MRRAALAAIALAASGCGLIVGIEDYVGPIDGPPGPDGSLNAVTIQSQITFTSGGSAGEDLSDYQFAAYIPDSSTTGYRSSVGRILGPGSAEIPDVPTGDYLFKVVNPVGQVRYYATDRRSLDLGYPVLGHAGSTELTTTSLVTVDATNMSSWVMTDQIIAVSLENGTVDIVNPATTTGYPGTGATSVSAMSFHWDEGVSSYETLLPRDIDRSADTVAFLHMTTAGNVLRLIESTAPITPPATGGLAFSGPFVARPLDQSLSATMTGFDAAITSPGATPAGHDMFLFAGPGAQYGLLVGYKLIDGTIPAASTSVGPLMYANPLGTDPLFMHRYRESRTYLLSGSTSGVQLASSATLLQLLTGTSVSLSPAVGAPDNVTLASVDVGRADASVTAPASGPIRVAWTAVPSATSYGVGLVRLYRVGNATRRQTVATLYTAGTTIDLPRDLFTSGESYVLEMSAYKGNATDYLQGRFRPRPLPFAVTQVVTGVFAYSEPDV